MEVAEMDAPALGGRGRGRDGSWSLDLPGVLPLALVAATWELLLLRVVVLAASVAQPAGLELLLAVLAKVGTFCETLAVLLALALIAETAVVLVRDRSFGPVTHRMTLAGFAAVVVVVCGVGVVVPVGAEASLMAHGAAVLLALLLVLGMLWHRVGAMLLAGAVLLLLPTLARFYAACAVSLPVLRTESAAPLYAFEAAEVVAVLAALLSPFLLAGLRPRDLLSPTALLAMGLASLPTVALSAAMAGSMDQVRQLCRAAVGFDLSVPPAQVVYPLALFAFLVTVAILVLPGFAAPRSPGDQRLGYGLGLLFLAGLDGLDGSVLAVGASAESLPGLVRYLLEGSWGQMTSEQQALIGPPLRDLYRVALLALGYLLVARGIQGRVPRGTVLQGPDDGGEP